VTEFCLTTRYHRKSAIRLLNRKPQRSRKARRGRPREYGHEVTRVLSSKLLAPFMPELIENLERHREISPSPEVRAKLLRISPATIDRLLKPFRLCPLRRPYAGSRRASLLRNKIAMRTFAELEVWKPATGGGSGPSLWYDRRRLLPHHPGWVGRSHWLDGVRPSMGQRAKSGGRSRGSHPPPHVQISVCKSPFLCWAASPATTAASSSTTACTTIANVMASSSHVHGPTSETTNHV